MARVTVEDCLEYVDTNYDLVLKAAKRASDIADGAQPLIEENGDKPVVIALREIAENISEADIKNAEEAESTIFDEDQDQSQEPISISIS